MCGRFVQSSKIDRYKRLFGLPDGGQGGNTVPRWNVAPDTCVWLCRWERWGKPGMVSLWWGFVPHWAKSPKDVHHVINARAETVAEKPFFRDAWRHGRRCLIPVDGFYEWRQEGNVKHPFYIRRRDGEPMALAGLWEEWRREAEDYPSTVIIVTEANDLMRPIHDRMPVILAPDAFGRWLDPATPADQALQLLRPYAGDDIEAVRVSTQVNNSRNNGPELVEPA